jgi:hypothetical protein
MEWQYFFGGGGGNTYDRYYKSNYKGIEVEKHASNNVPNRYAIGNIDNANEIFKSELDLMNFIDKLLDDEKKEIKKV